MEIMVDLCYDRALEDCEFPSRISPISHLYYDELRVAPI